MTAAGDGRAPGPSGEGVDAAALQALRHDLRAPLVVVAGFAELLAGEADITPDDRRDYARRIAAAAAELRALLDERLGA